MWERREAAGLAPAAQQALDESAADTEAGGEGALRAGAFIERLRDPLTQFRRLSFHD